MPKQVRVRLAEEYESMNKWASLALGPQDSIDYVHDAVVSILDSQYAKGLTDEEFIGLWQLMTQKAYWLRKAEQKGLSLSMTDNDFTNEDVLNHSDAIDKVRSIVKSMLRHIPFTGRKVIYRLFILGESSRQCACALGITRHNVESVRYRTMIQLSAMVERREI